MGVSGVSLKLDCSSFLQNTTLSFFTTTYQMTTKTLMGRKKGSLSEEGPSTWNSHIRTVYKKLKCFQSYNNPNKKCLAKCSYYPSVYCQKPAHIWVLFVVSHKACSTWLLLQPSVLPLPNLPNNSAITVNHDLMEGRERIKGKDYPLNVS